MKKVLFVCTANIFRSFSAHYSFLDYLERNNIKGYEVDSAGTGYKVEYKAGKAIFDTLRELGVINFEKHKPKQITEKIVDDSDVIIVMSHRHENYIKENFGREVYYFNELIGRGRTDLKDIWEMVDDWENNLDETDRYIKKIVKYIYDNTAKVYESIKKI